ncbi:hypothetical protein BC831DRAFT_483214 [Entophlyctis helioformis]|nr:hypothetical protein BC831DRAFT_483214 [Entophlyctis helioformis]
MTAATGVILSGGGARPTTKRTDKTNWIRGEQVIPVNLSQDEHAATVGDEYEDLNSYHPPAPTSHVVVAMYIPQKPDEMLLQPGDLIGIERTYKDGWARGQNISQSRKRAIFPLAIVTPIVSGPTQTVRKMRGNVWMGSGSPPNTPLTPGTPEEQQQMMSLEQREAEREALSKITPRDDSLRRLKKIQRTSVGAGGVTTSTTTTTTQYVDGVVSFEDRRRYVENGDGFVSLDRQSLHSSSSEETSGLPSQSQ